MKIVSELQVKYIFVRAINSPCKQSYKGTSKNEGHHPCETKRPVSSFRIVFYAVSYTNDIFNVLESNSFPGVQLSTWSFKGALFVKSLYFSPSQGLAVMFNHKLQFRILPFSNKFMHL